ncbi:GTP cyclohydrolase [Nocardia sp. NPDC004654]|uniref:GTP cyclohydrolase n=1 Tax=Nocardia sp. NPDC004654 TaxID=3154776 RepID=UPI0033B6C0E5
MDQAAFHLRETGHRLTRKGRELRVRVMAIPGAEDGGHAMIFGPIADACLVRIHSRCLYGDALRSDDCDCGPELDLSMDMIQNAGCGVLVYLEQEGRGAGLVDKARGLRTSEVFGLDTFDSYERLGLCADTRSYENAARALVHLGIAVTVVPLVTRPRSERARRYLEAKRRRRGHTIPDESASTLGRAVWRSRRRWFMPSCWWRRLLAL